MNSLENGILKAIAYADVFDFGLTKIELWQRYIGNKQVELVKIKGSLAKLLKMGRVEIEDNYVFFPGRGEVVRLRKSRLRATTDKYIRARRITQWLSKIPWVKGVFLTGTVAVDNALADDDIDLMIVAQSNYLWTTRLVTTGLLELLGTRRKPGQTEATNFFCVNLYLDESNMTVPKELQNLYTAHEVILAKCLYERDGIAAKFVYDNRWVKKYLPNTAFLQVRSKRHQYKDINPLENWLFKLQRKYMSRRITREKVTKYSAYFHPKDMALWVLSRYNLILKKYEVKQ